jgi:hypothetical protein
MFMLTDAQSIGNNIRHTFAVTTSTVGISPTTAANFVGLDGTASGTIMLAAASSSPGVYTTCATGNCAAVAWGANSGSHLYPGHFEVNKVSHDLYYWLGQSDGDGGNCDGGLGIQMARMVPNGLHNWTAVTSSVIVTSPCTGAQGVGITGPPSPKIVSTQSTANYVWLLYSDPSYGLVIDRWDSSGTRSARYLTPYALTPNSFATGGAFYVAPDETRIWVLDSMETSTGGTRALQWGGGIYYDGASWTNYGPGGAGTNDTTAFAAMNYANYAPPLFSSGSTGFDGVMAIFAGGNQEVHYWVLQSGIIPPPPTLPLQFRTSTRIRPGMRFR